MEYTTWVPRQKCPRATELKAGRRTGLGDGLGRPGVVSLLAAAALQRVHWKKKKKGALEGQGRAPCLQRSSLQPRVDSRMALLRY